MTYNLRGQRHDITAAVDMIRTANVDVVFLQEINPRLASAIRSELAGAYPYQYLDPKDGATGMGTISKYPIRPTGTTVPLHWVGVPQILELDWNGQTVTVINFHMWASEVDTPEAMVRTQRGREAQARVLAGLARNASGRGPVIAAGDANTTDLSAAYKIVTGSLTDSWREAGYGFGHTFPGSDVRSSSHPHGFSRLVPQWLVRIDYVFHSDQLETVEAELAKSDGVSDHRGVVVTLAMAK